MSLVLDVSIAIARLFAAEHEMTMPLAGSRGCPVSICCESRGACYTELPFFGSDEGLIRLAFAAGVGGFTGYVPG
jgi:hypothetical protein